MGFSTRLARAAGVGATVIALVVTTIPAQAQQMEGKSRIELQLGMTFPGGTTVSSSVGNIVNEVQSVAGMGAIAYSHWVREQVAIVFSAGATAVEVESSVGAGGVRSRTAVVSPLMGGVRLYLAESTVGSGLRPYGSITAGPVFGTENESAGGPTIINRSRT
jgi:hypothetical protein